MSDYHINIFYSDEDGGYVADIPDLEACSAFGETPEKALAEVERAKAAWLEAARVETDADKRIRLYRQAEKKIVADAPWLFLAYARNAVLIKPYVHGIRLGPMDSGSELPRVDFTNVWLDPVP